MKGHLAWLHGDYAQAHRHIDVLRARLAFMDTMLDAAEAGVLVDEGRLEAAHAAYRSALHGLTTMPRNAAWGTTLVFTAYACARVGDREGAERLYRLLVPFEDLVVVLPPGIVFGPASYFLGLLAEVLGHTDEAIGRLEKAIETNQRSRTTHLRALAEVALAGILMRGDDADQARARTLLMRAHATAESQGLPAIAERARELQATSRYRICVAPKRRECAFEDGTGRLTTRTLIKGITYLAYLVPCPARHFEAFELERPFAPVSHGEASPSFEDSPSIDGYGARESHRPPKDRAALLEAKDEASERLARAVEEDDEVAANRARRLVSEIERVLNEWRRHNKLNDGVSANLRFAIGKIRERHPQLAEHLDESIKRSNGTWYYEPAASSNVRIEIVWDYSELR
jgi:tetratricopeptide (TPR) repeat protein